MSNGIRVTVWNEGLHEQELPKCREIYPDGMGRQIGRYLEKQPGIASVHCSELSDPEQGLSEEILANTDVMTWWGHKAHDRVTDENAERVQKRVLQGMGLIVLHSGHMARVWRTGRKGTALGGRSSPSHRGGPAGIYRTAQHGNVRRAFRHSPA